MSANVHQFGLQDAAIDAAMVAVERRLDPTYTEEDLVTLKQDDPQEYLEAKELVEIAVRAYFGALKGKEQ